MERLKEILVSLWLNRGAVISTAIVIGILCLLCSCTRTITQYVPQYHTKYINQIQRDTIIKSDSVYIKEFVKGDTIFSTKYKYVYLDKIKLKLDTIFQSDTITLYVDRPQTLHQLSETELELQYQKNQNLQLRVLLGLGLAIIISMVICQFRKPLKKVINMIRNFICRLV